MKVFISFQGTTRAYQFDADTTILDIKHRLAHLLGRLASQFCLSYNDRIVQDTQTLAHYNIHEGDTLDVNDYPTPSASMRQSGYRSDDLQQERDLWVSSLLQELGSMGNGHEDIFHMEV